jgi:hypothetical protein
VVQIAGAIEHARRTGLFAAAASFSADLCRLLDYFCALDGLSSASHDDATVPPPMSSTSCATMPRLERWTTRRGVWPSPSRGRERGGDAAYRALERRA